LDIGINPLTGGMQILPLGWQEIVCTIARIRLLHWRQWRNNYLKPNVDHASF
jgi:hypothetical protein